MALTYSEMYDLAVEESGLRNRTAIAISDILPDIFNESEATTYHTERVAWTQHASGNLMQVRDQMMWTVVAHSLVDTHGTFISDSDLKDVVSSLVNIYATAYYEDLQARLNGTA